VFSKGENYIVAYVPDFNINTQGKDFAEAFEMARDAIGIMGIDMEDEKEAIPAPSDISEVKKENDSDIISLVDVDFAEYRKRNDRKTVRRNVALPLWLDSKAEKSGVNVSAVLQKA